MLAVLMTVFDKRQVSCRSSFFTVLYVSKVANLIWRLQRTGRGPVKSNRKPTVIPIHTFDVAWLKQDEPR